MRIRRCKSKAKKKEEKGVPLSKELSCIADWLLSKTCLEKNEKKKAAFEEVYKKITGTLPAKLITKGKKGKTKRESLYKCMECSYATLSKGEDKRIDCSYYNEAFSSSSIVCQNFKQRGDCCMYCVHYNKPDLEDKGLYRWGRCSYYRAPAFPTEGTTCENFYSSGKE